MPDPQLRAVLKRPFQQQAAFFRAKLGNLVPTEGWRDMLRQQHDRGVMVAGAQSIDLLTDLAAAIDRAVVEGVSIQSFRKDFKAAVTKAGWDYRGEFNWRTRVIYQTNIATSYAAGRLAQLREGGFAHWMYKHGGSREPRPQHLAWDGMVLPADHAFWKAHFPPNEWGCSCRVVGLRKPEDARRLGGDPDKTLAPGWKPHDPADGPPPGVGEGWDYMPGDTVSQTVQAMAAKTRQWEYELAKAYMTSLPDTLRDALAVAYRNLPSVADDARRYAQRILEARTALDVPPYRTLGPVTSKQARRIERDLGQDITGFDFSLDAFAPLHVQRRHGNEKTEAARGQRTITAADYARMPAVLNAPTGRRVEGDEVIFEKVFGNERMVLVFVPLIRRRTLVLRSMRVYRKASPRSTA